MKRLLSIIATAAIVCGFAACNDDDNQKMWDQYADWREKNTEWLTQQQLRTDEHGNPYYKTVVPGWNPAAYVLIHYCEDPAPNADKLVPLSTSTVDTRYILHYCDDTPVDSSYNNSSYGPGIFRTQLTQVIEGWTIAMEQMHVGDTCEIIIPYASAYGTNTSSGILPYSNLRFNVRLVNIVDYEKNPK